ncbi:flagellar hook-basal body complex protein FliE [Blastopirellula marina]|uniref:Flagellar hook-basal body complex protein FliE n=1 Tax=Blastopirellula marina TaxID=124 RepID=A0A2S8F294_9BACT|nr:flagellar hook-basal body complex protein FliE [Blastopirellula marina]PQO26269.1 flagellar hook-basal body complex protein FliE [Blastopirellula marina]PQO47148.1 flagellar hook-basal body complex protein FliE [Blastopirellula marina]PTL40669.1 flagellar hook-basal body complex protein FliE [Blastopirellula marina]
MKAIHNISPQTILPSHLTRPAGTAQSHESFANLFIEGFSRVNEMQQQADRAVEQLQTGGDVNPSEVLIAVQKADVEFKLMMQVRNKMLQAYQEIKDIRI